MNYLLSFAYLPGDFADEILVQVSYAIGVARPMGIFIDTGTSKLNLTNGELPKK
jgi:S-adenosylmethionine synthetase